MHLAVDGEVFDAQERADEPGVYDVSWESAREPRHAFSIARNTRERIGEDELTEVIREFLANINPETGHID